MSTILGTFFGALLVALIILAVVDVLYREKLDWLKCRLCKWWNREAQD
jgi:hypothetical protein